MKRKDRKPHSADWIPIRFAPKDGTPILVCGGTYGCDGSPCEFHGVELKVPIVSWWLRVNEPGCGGWVTSCMSADYCIPTHFQYLPEWNPPPHKPTLLQRLKGWWGK